ncbi:MAG: response regulator [Myxococcota bacterium]
MTESFRSRGPSVALTSLTSLGRWSDWFFSVQSDDPDVKRRGQAQILLLAVYAILPWISLPLMGLAAGLLTDPGYLTVMLTAPVQTALYLTGIALSQRGQVSFAAFIVSFLIGVLLVFDIIVLSQFTPAAYLAGLCIVSASFGMRSSGLFVVFLTTAGHLVFAKWYVDGTLYAEADLSFPIAMVLLTAIFVYGFIYAYWNEVVFARQIQARRAAEQSSMVAETARQAAERANEAKSTFLANMSHELRTPLNAIIGYAQMLAEDSVDEESVEDLTKIERSGRHLLLLINDLLDLARIEAGHVELSFDRVSLGELLRTCVDDLQPLVQLRNNELHLRAPPTGPTLWTDLTKVRQIVLNLLSNAAKFTNNGKIQVQLREFDETIEIEVQDTGIGIPQERLDTIFEGFEQGSQEINRNYGGTGLGLAVCRKLAELLEGSVTVISAPGEGSTFTMRLPKHHSGLRDEVTPIAGIPLPVPEGDFDPAHPTVLLVDDDQAMHEQVRHILAGHELNVVGVTTGEQGLAWVRNRQTALVLLDVLLPQIDGWEVLRELRRLHRSLPVVMLSVVDAPSHAQELGAVAYLVKPIERTRILQTVTRFLSPSRPPVRILVVDDDGAARRSLRTSLADIAEPRPGPPDGPEFVIEFREARNGAEALGLLQQAPADLIVLDLMMPKMDGFETLRLLQEHPGWRDIPVIVLTNKELSPTERDRLGHLVLDVRTKRPDDQHTLGELVRSALTPS